MKCGLELLGFTGHSSSPHHSRLTYMDKWLLVIHMHEAPIKFTSYFTVSLATTNSRDQK